MQRDYGIEIDHLKKELGDLKEILLQKLDLSPTLSSHQNPAEPTKPGICSFCKKEPAEDNAIISGPGANICNTCVDVCKNVLTESEKMPGCQTIDISNHASGIPVGFVTTYRENINCSFCGKSEEQVEKTIAGPDVYICDCCVAFSAALIVDNPNKKEIAFVLPSFQHVDYRLRDLMQTLQHTTNKERRTGSVTCFGMFKSAGRESHWIEDRANTDTLLSLIENKTAALVLQSIGNNDRLNLLLAILKSPMNVTKMVEVCGFNSSGQVYHHLRPLIAADLVYESEQGERGVYAIVPYRVQGIIMVLVGISFLVDTKYKAGEWAHDSAVDVNTK